MRSISNVVACVLFLAAAVAPVPCASGQAQAYPPHPLWPEGGKDGGHASCEMKFLPGVDASLWNPNLWPGGYVPYVIDSAVTPENRDRLRIAMNELETNCDVLFVPRNGDPNYLYIQNGGGNNSFVGQIGGGQTVNLVSWTSRYVIIHELMHALGVWHEQNRSDRDPFVIINQANIQSQYYNPNFTVQNGATPEGTYNFESIMHYDACSFSTCCPTGSTCQCPTNCRSIDVQPAYAQFANVMGNRSYLSNGDKSGLVSRYGTEVDDSFEHNDTLATAYPLPVAFSNTFRLYDTDDYFSVAQPNTGPVAFSFSAGLWCASNVTLSMLTPGGVVLASATPTDADADGTYTAFLTAQTSPGVPVIIRINRSQPWGGQYDYSTSSSCVPEPWQQVVAGTSPTARVGQTMAFDSVRGQAVLFGGETSGGLSAETWTWNGTSWTQRMVPGPSARVHAMSVYDAARGRVVLFGGRSGNTYFNDTWEWDGSAWVQVTTANAPSVRALAGMSFDVLRSRTVLFGGNTTPAGGLVGDTWEYDGANWVQRSSGGPSARQWPVMAYHEARQRTVLFGGTDGTNIAPQDTWEWNGTTGVWTRSQVIVPNVGISKSMVYNPIRGVCVVFSGYIGGQFIPEMWEYSGTAWIQRPAVHPEARYSHSMVWDATRQEILCFGGETAANARNGDLWAFNGLRWQPLAGPQSPSARSAHSMAFRSSDGTGVLFGGDNNVTRLDDTWAWSAAGSVWGRLAPPTSPAPRSLSACAWDSTNNRLVMFGGIGNDGQRTGQTWEFSISTGWQLKSPANSPSPRDSAMMVFDAARNVCLLYGGTLGGSNVFSDTWLWNGVNWTNANVAGPGPRRSGYMAYDNARQRVVLFGGYNGTDDWGDTWEWNGTSWSLRATLGPTPRRGGAMAYDAERGRCVLLGGRVGLQNNATDEVWEWDGTNWQIGFTTDFGKRIDFAFGSAGATKGLFLFGGYDFASAQPLGDAARFDAIADPPSFTSQPQNATVNSGTQAVFNAPATDAGSFNYRWYATTNNAGVQGSVALNDLDRGGRVLGVFTPQLRINNAQASDATSQPVPGVFVNQYFCVASNVCQSATSNPATLTVNTPPPACLGDLTGDNVVNVVDLTIFLGQFGSAVTPGTGADFDANGVVNVIDLTIFLGRFGQTCT